MKTLIYLLTISLLIISCEKNELSSPEITKELPKIKHVRFHIVRDIMGKPAIAGAFVSKYDSLGKETKIDALKQFRTNSDTSKWITIETQKTRLYIYTEDHNNFCTIIYTIKSDSATIRVTDAFPIQKE